MRHMLLGVHEVTTSSHMVQFAVVISEKLTLKYLWKRAEGICRVAMHPTALKYGSQYAGAYWLPCFSGEGHLSKPEQEVESDLAKIWCTMCRRSWRYDQNWERVVGQLASSVNAALIDICSSTIAIDVMIVVQDGQSRTVRQFQFTDWPEHGLPSGGETFIEFIGQVHKTKEQFGHEGPITVHCRFVRSACSPALVTKTSSY